MLQLKAALGKAQQQAMAAEADAQGKRPSGYDTWIIRRKQAEGTVVKQLGGKESWVPPGGMLILLWKAMHRLLSKACHPNKNQEDAVAHKQQQNLSLAWELISSCSSDA